MWFWGTDREKYSLFYFIVLCLSEYNITVEQKSAQKVLKTQITVREKEDE